jgi:hypothetical protein
MENGVFNGQRLLVTRNKLKGKSHYLLYKLLYCQFPMLSPVFLFSPTCYRKMCVIPSPTNNTHQYSLVNSLLYIRNILHFTYALQDINSTHKMEAIHRNKH